MCPVIVRIRLQYSASQISTMPRFVPIASVLPCMSACADGHVPMKKERLTLLVHSKPVIGSPFSSALGEAVDVSQSFVTLLVCALHKYTQELSPTPRTFDEDHDTRLR